MDEEGEKPVEPGDLVRLTTAIVAGYVAGNLAQVDRLSALIGQVHRALADLGQGEPAAPAKPQKPAVPVSRSVQPDHIVCLEDGKKLKMLKRYLRARYAMNPDQYRRKWSLPPDYPMVAPNYAARRSEFAKRIGLGKRGRRTQ
ncbi:MAG: Ros/MucR family transcriptional regulator [Caulobacteraceae bacterium]